MFIHYRTSDELAQAIRKEWRRHKILLFGYLIERAIRKMNRKGLDKTSMARALTLAAKELEKAV